MNVKYICLLLAVLCTQACVIPEIPESTDGMRPIYVRVDLNDIVSTPAREFGDLGKIVLLGDLLFINEFLEGIHVIDNSNPSEPVSLVFWNIPGNIDFIVVDGLLYADNSRDIYVIDISDIFDIQVLFLIENAYGQPAVEQLYPRDYEGFFECVDTAKGIVVDWEMTTLTRPKCNI